MTFTHIDKIDGRLCSIKKFSHSTPNADWYKIIKFYAQDDSIEEQLINYSFLEQLNKPVKKIIDYDFMSYAE